MLEPLLRDTKGKDPNAERQAQHLLAAVMVHEKREGEAVELLDRDEVGVLLGQAMGRHARPGEGAEPAGPDGLAIERRPLPCHREPFFPACRGREHPDQRLARTHERDRDRPAVAPAHEVAGAIDRIDQPDQPACRPHLVVGGLLGQPSGRGQQASQLALEKAVDLEIGLAHRAARSLVPAMQRVARPRPARMGDPARLADDGL